MPGIGTRTSYREADAPRSPGFLPQLSILGAIVSPHVLASGTVSAGRYVLNWQISSRNGRMILEKRGRAGSLGDSPATIWSGACMHLLTGT